MGAFGLLSGTRPRYGVRVNLPEPWNSLVGAVTFFAAIVCVKMFRRWMRERHDA
jgi:hypothetical protein